jgi:hypothetical protein
MRAVISLFLMLSLVCQCAVQLGVLAWYELNKDFIAKNLCENRNRPDIGCNGKCQLSKQLKKADPHDEHSTGKESGKNLRAEWIDLLVAETVFIRPRAAYNLHVYTPVVQHMFGYTPLVSVFHPPAC